MALEMPCFEVNSRTLRDRPLGLQKGIPNETQHVQKTGESHA
jgi:hypothetical protein